MSSRVFANAGAQSTCASPITSSQTTVTLVSAGGFPAVPAGKVLDVIILDSGNPLFDKNNPLATPYEYQPVSGIAGNVLTFGGGVRAAYAGTTPHAYLAGATVAAVILGEGISANPGNSHGVSVWQSGAQAINPSGFVNMPYDQYEVSAGVSDPEGRWDNANRRYTCPAVAGVVLVTMGWVHDGSSCRVIVGVGKNSTSEYARLGDCTGIAAYGARRLVTAANDQLYPLVWQNSGVQVHNVPTFLATYFTVQWLGDL